MKTQNRQDTLDFAGLDDWFPVFRTGMQTDSQGRKRKFTEQDLDSMVANHSDDEAAPFVFGHPKHNDPSYGWTAGLKRDGDLLFAKGRDVVSEFETAVKKKMFPKRSISIEPVDGGGWRLRHVGFLGAKRPAVEGLGEIEFSASDDVMEFSVDADTLARRSGWALGSLARLLRGLREDVIARLGMDEADKLLPNYEIENLSKSGDFLSSMPDERANFSAHQIDQPGGRDVNKNPEKEFTQADIDKAVTDALAAEQKKTAEREQNLRFTARKAEAEKTITTLVDEGKLLPAQTEGLAEFVAGLAEADDAAFEFAAADDKTEKKTPAAFFTEFLGSLGKQIDLGEQAGGQHDDARQSPNSDYHGHQVNAERAELDAKARDYMAQHNVDYVTAVTAVEDAG